MSENAIHPTDTAARRRIRTGQEDLWKQDVYKKSESGRYEEEKDPNRIANRPIAPISKEGRLDYHERALNRDEQISGISRQETQFANEAAWAREKSRQEQEYASYQQQAESVGGTPYRGQNGYNYIQNLNVDSTGQMRMQLINAGLSMQGQQYSWGGGGYEGPSRGSYSRSVSGQMRDGRSTVGFDCSGLLQFAYSKVGMQMPRTARQQAQMGRLTTVDRLKPGDLVGWGSNPSSAHHIAIYMGNGKILESGRGFGMHEGVRTRTLGNNSFDRQAFGVALGI